MIWEAPRALVEMLLLGAAHQMHAQSGPRRVIGGGYIWSVERARSSWSFTSAIGLLAAVFGILVLPQWQRRSAA